MDSDKWVYDKLPEPLKKVLVFDLIEGQMVGYYDMRMNTFLDINNVVIGYVGAWQELPQDPKTVRTIFSNIMSYKPSLKPMKEDKEECTEKENPSKK